MSKLTDIYDWDTDYVRSRIFVDASRVDRLVQALENIKAGIFIDCKEDEQQRLTPLAFTMQEWMNQIEWIFSDCVLSEDRELYLLPSDDLDVDVWKDSTQTYMTTFNRDFHYDDDKPGHHNIHEHDKIVREIARSIARDLGVEIDSNAGLE